MRNIPARNHLSQDSFMVLKNYEMDTDEIFSEHFQNMHLNNLCANSNIHICGT